MAKKLCLKRHYGNDGSLEVFLACKPMALNKNPAVKLIGIAEDIRIIVCWAFMTTFRKKKKKVQVNFVQVSTRVLRQLGTLAQCSVKMIAMRFY